MNKEIQSTIEKINKLRKLIGTIEKYFPALKAGADHAEVYEENGKYILYSCLLSYPYNEPSNRKTEEISEKEFLSQLNLLHKNLLQEARTFLKKKIIDDLVESALRDYR